uniref:uncharacterized protein YER152C n=1 Tax=Ciona intestinalis TaxID=7719 RepID=UPI0000522220|nr:uncharacterized protein YER152C [Ciona intestinalis]|eukprot:XP_018667032.1 uncharacterized protein YER152C [Ciona intestinalis]
MFSISLKKFCLVVVGRKGSFCRLHQEARLLCTSAKRMDYPRNDFEDGGLLKPGHYSLQVGAPGPAFLKQISEHLKVASENLRTTDRFEETLQYGCVAGGYPVKEEVAKFLTRQYGDTVQSDNIYITPGATQGLVNMIKHYFTHENSLFVENPTYPVFAIRVAADKLMNPVPISMESDGMNIDELEKKLADLPVVETTERRPYRAAMYIIPTHHNPTGCCYSPEKCRRLIELAREHNLLIICDDVYNILNYSLDTNDSKRKFEFSPQRLFAYDNPSDPEYKGNVVSNGSFAKIIAPGLRMGWYEAPAHVIASLKISYIANSGSGQCFYISHVVSEALKLGVIDNHVENLRLAHKDRMQAVISIVERKLSKYGVTITHPNGGYFLWVKLPQKIKSAQVLEVSKKTENVTFIKGELASVKGDFDNYIRLSIAYYELEEIKKGAEGLCRAIEAVIQNHSSL